MGARPVRRPDARARHRGASTSRTCWPRRSPPSDEVRRRLIELVASEAVVGPEPRRRGRRRLSSLPPDALARHLIGGLTVAESGLDLGKLKGSSLIAAAIDDDSTFVLPPLPNSLFTRDSSCWIYGGVSINPMYWPARRREAYNMAAIYRAHPMFRDASFDYWYPHDGRGRPVPDSRTSAGRRSRAATSRSSATGRWRSGCPSGRPAG